MKRKIKFRAKTTANGHWVYGSLIDYGDNTFAIKNSKSQPWVQAETIGQFTGRPDRNGREIYEGDVVDVISFFTIPRDKEMGRTRAVIEFDKDQASFIAKARSINFAMTCANNMEIVGNIHEQSKVRTMKRKKKKGLYQTNKAAKIGETIECPVCHTKFTKIQWAQAFCCGQCKDKFWNTRCKDRHRYKESPDDGMTDHDWDEAFGVAEYND